ncbi:hypothetical protein KY290_005793 [Solanum tuberosum]|uniref:Uncharacterized protein n=1 Tax=Solanum tuberosum TaxID=4113 RepID=A0ABQ7WF62_SOLTU|nr:hypothetical protein KY284_006692 [Solanum tuberosum]KAH0723098.1 hypothetical protein KY289_006142 [Solanum tuberosum]KAH0752543.1 hypothetical protein KY285_005691 [Solanum tuberosum]KAH0779366.1 hypothetical protein KY290_005793 [Solanum tuberosum]
MLNMREEVVLCTIPVVGMGAMRLMSYKDKLDLPPHSPASPVLNLGRISAAKDLGLEWKWIDQFEGHPSIRLKDSLFCLLNQNFDGAGTYMFQIDDEHVIDTTKAGIIAHLINRFCETCGTGLVVWNGTRDIYED